MTIKYVYGVYIKKKIIAFEGEGLVMEYYPMGSLRKFLHHRKTTNEPIPLSNQDKVKIMLKLSEGMKHLHEKGFLHKDLKPNNILMKSVHKYQQKQVVPLIMDYGAGIHRGQPLRGSPGTSGYIAPEVLQWHNSTAMAKNELAKSNASSKFDVFSFSIIMNEILSNNDKWIDDYYKKNPIKNNIVECEKDKFEEANKGLRCYCYECFKCDSNRPMVKEWFKGKLEWHQSNEIDISNITLNNSFPLALEDLRNYCEDENRQKQTSFRPEIRANEIDVSIRKDMTKLIKDCWSTNKDERPEFDAIAKRLQKIKKQLESPKYQPKRSCKQQQTKKMSPYIRKRTNNKSLRKKGKIKQPR